MADKTISHEGIIEELSDRKVRVKITSRSACAGCHAKSSCNIADDEIKQIEVFSTREDFRVGENVEVLISMSLGFRALTIAYIVPFLLVLLAIIILISVTGNELVSGLLSLLILVPYYILLKMNNHKFEDTFSFTLKKLIKQA